MNDLITLDFYKQAKAITSAKDDERLGLLIPAISRLVKTYCNNSFNDYIDTDKIEYFSLDYAVNRIMLSEMNAISITSVSERAAESDSYTELTTSDYALDRKTDTITRLGGDFPSGVESVLVEYKAGYSPIPTELGLAVVDLVTYYYKEEHKVTMSLQGATVTNSSTSTLPGNIGFPNHIKRVLDMYRQL